MKKRFLFFEANAFSADAVALVVCGVFFFCGCVAGTLASVSTSDASQISTYFSSIFLAAQADEDSVPIFPVTLWRTCQYHLAAFFLGFSLLGAFLIPLLCGLRGFVLAFSISAMIRLYGSGGIIPAIAIFGLQTILSVPCLFVLSSQALTSSSLLLRSSIFSPSGRSGPLYGRTYWTRCGVCFALLVLTALYDTYLASYFIRYLSAFI